MPYESSQLDKQAVDALHPSRNIDPDHRSNPAAPISGAHPPPAQTSPAPPVDIQPASQSASTNNAKRMDAYNEAIQRIVDEEKLISSQMPVYKGLERYKLIEKMGDGAFSIVYQALDTKTGDKVAVKAVHKQDLSSSQVSF